MSPKTSTKTSLIERPPVIAIMGHIDHGKSTLLDYIRKTNITDKEAGGITQHIAAYEVTHERNGKKQQITFLDTPGHAAFKGIRVRGATVADIAVLVVSGEEGVKPQTLEALGCIKEAGIPYLVAINKIDSPKANVERTKQSLAEHEIYVEGYGGQVPWVAISAKSGEGIPELLDLLLLLAELGDFKADPQLPAEGIVIESNLDQKKGISGTLIIKNGTLKKGMTVVCDDSFAPVRLMENFLGKPLDSATFSSPVRLIGFNKFPKIGGIFKAYDAKKEALEVVEARSEKIQAAKHISQNQASKNNSSAGPLPTNDIEPAIINLIIKADVAGTLEAIEGEIAKLKHDNIDLRIVSTSIGSIGETDVKMALVQPGTKIIGFSVKFDVQAKSLADRLNVEVHTFDIIYKLVEWIEALIKSNTPKVSVEEVAGNAKILKIFSKNKDKQIVGGRVLDGEIRLGAEVRIMRRDIEIGRGKVRELQKQKEKATEVGKDSEFGTMIESKMEIAPGDKIECVTIVTR